MNTKEIKIGSFGEIKAGMIVFEVDDNGKFDFEQAVVKIDSQKAKIIKI